MFHKVWDEAKRLRCEWYNDYEKTASKPPMVIADLDVVALNFRGEYTVCIAMKTSNWRIFDEIVLVSQASNMKVESG